MGFRPERTTIRLQFEDPTLAGLEVTARVPSLGRMLDVAGARDLALADGLGGARKFFDFFADALIDWNLEDELGQKVARTVDGLLSLETGLAMTIVLAWFDGLTAVSTNLGKGSTSGRQYPEVSIPMEIPSPNLPNSPTLD